MHDLTEGSRGDDLEQRAFTFEELELILHEALREVFMDCFERKFGRPACDVLDRLKDAPIGDLKQWIPNITDAARVEDVFVPDLDRALAKFAAAAIKRKSDIDVGDVVSLAQLRSALENHS